MYQMTDLKMNTSTITTKRLMLIAFLLGLFSLMSVIIFTTMQLHKSYTFHEKVISEYLALIDISDINKNGKKLAYLHQLTQFEVTTANNKSLFAYNSASSTSLLDTFMPERKITTLNNKLHISFKLSSKHYVEQISVMAAILFFCLLLFSYLTKREQIKESQKTIGDIDNSISRTFKTAFDNSDSKKPINNHLPSVNHGIEQAKTLIEEAHLDPLTKAENRTRFVQFFESKCNGISTGVLTITRCSELETLNKTHGYTEGDNYIINVATLIKNIGENHGIKNVFRLNSSDFATLMVNVSIEDAEKFTEALTIKFNEYQSNMGYDSVAFTGLVAFDKEHPLGELLALADTGISVAQTQLSNAWHSQTDSNILADSNISYGNQNWRQEIDSVIENQRVKLFTQPIIATKNNKTYHEILARFLSPFDETFPTISFIAMAEKLDKIVEIDRMIIEKAITEIHKKNNKEHSYGINISARTIQDEHFLIWLERRLLRESNICSQLVFEISEFGLQQNIKISKRFIDMLHRVGARLTVERFGVGLTSFKFFRDIKPDFIKMDSTYTRDIDEDKNNQYFLRLMVDLAHRLGIKVLVESVESQNEKLTLDKLFIDGYQGFYLGKPTIFL